MRYERRSYSLSFVPTQDSTEDLVFRTRKSIDAISVGVAPFANSTPSATQPKNELINNHRWKDVLEVAIATFEWVTWWNQTRLDQALDYRTPVEVDNDYWRIASTLEKMKTRANAQEVNPGHFRRSLKGAFT